MAILKRNLDKEEMKKLSEEELRDVDGGYIYHDVDIWYVLDDNTGQILAYRYQKQNIVTDAQNLGQSTRELSHEEWVKLRNGKSI